MRFLFLAPVLALGACAQIGLPPCNEAPWTTRCYADDNGTGPAHWSPPSAAPVAPTPTPPAPVPEKPSKPGHGHGDKNHDHTGPRGRDDGHDWGHDNNERS